MRADVRGPPPQHAEAGQVQPQPRSASTATPSPGVTDLPLPCPPHCPLGIHKSQESVKNQGKNSLPEPPRKCPQGVDERLLLGARGKDGRGTCCVCASVSPSHTSWVAPSAARCRKLAPFSKSYRRKCSNVKRARKMQTNLLPLCLISRQQREGKKE